MNYDPKVHRRRSIRLKGHDYSQLGAYFITICAYDKKCLFGKIIDHKMVLNQFGTIAYNEWMKSITIRTEIELDSITIMPNHIHGIVFICNQTIKDARFTSTKNRLSALKPASIPSFIAGYKSSVTRQINQIRKRPGAPVWQRNYYEHIIRNEVSLEMIREYILYNPKTWEKDTLFSES